MPQNASSQKETKNEQKLLKYSRSRYFAKVKQIYDEWEKNESGLGNVSSFVAICGDQVVYDPDDDASTSFFQWLSGYISASSLAFFTKDQICLVCNERSARLAAHLEAPVESGNVPQLEIKKYSTIEEQKKHLTEIIKSIESIGNVGFFFNQKPVSKTVPIWKEMVDEMKVPVDTVDMKPVFFRLSCIKDDEEIHFTRQSAEMVVNSWLAARKTLRSYVYERKEVTHGELVKTFDKHFKDKDIQGNLISYKPLSGCMSGSGANCLTGFFKERSDAILDSSNGPIITRLYAIINRCYVQLTRTVLVNPSERDKSVYEMALEMQNAVIDALKPGVTFKEVHEAGRGVLKRKNYFLVRHCKSDFGYLLDTTDKSMTCLISKKCERVVCPKMVFSVKVELADFLPLEEAVDSKLTSILLSDFVLVNEDGPNEILTERATRDFRYNMAFSPKDKTEVALSLCDNLS